LEIKQYEREIGVLRDQGHGLAASSRFQNDSVTLQLNDHAAQRLADQHVIVDNKEFHSGVPSCNGTRLLQGIIESSLEGNTNSRQLPQADFWQGAR
jgi:hypothetical protein